ncbi:MAG: hypothetical protein IPN34_21385 [Planctomycetes bacterium]|nr:hypothetical protein [Planctomycetota bacterium]
MSPASAFTSPLREHRNRIRRFAAHLVQQGLSRVEIAIAESAAELAESRRVPPRLARLALEAALSRLEPRTAPLRPSTIRVATAADHSQHGPAPSLCWFCSTTAWWKTEDRTARWLCAHCVAPDSDLAALWYEPSAAALEDADREPRWNAAPERDDYFLLRSRRLARNAARAAADMLGSWRPASPRTSADLRALDWFAITDAAAIVAIAEDLRGWVLELDGAARAIARRALCEVLGWPARETAAVLERALELLRAATPENAIAALGPAWPSGHEPGSHSPIPLRVDSATEVLVPAHPHLVLLLRGVGAGQFSARATSGPTAKQRKHIDDVAHASKRLAGSKRAEALDISEPSSSPPASCHSCRGQRFFRLDAQWSTWTCAVCHPPVLPTERFVMAGTNSPASIDGEAGSNRSLAEAQR